MAGRDEVRVVKPVFLRNGEPIPVWELAKLNEPGKIGVAKSGSRSEAAKKAWETIRRKRAMKADELA